MKKLFFSLSLVLTIGIGVFLMYSIWGAVTPRTAEQYRESGKQYLEEKRYPEAVVEFMNALQKEPRDRDAYWLLAKTYQAQNDMNSAVRQLKTLLEYFPDDQEANLQIGNIYLTGGSQNAAFFRQAKEIAEKILAMDSQNVQATVLLGNALAGLQDYTSSVEQFEKALRIDPENSSTLVGLGATEAVQKNYSEAEQSFLKARQIDPKNKAALISLGAFYSAIGKHSDAEAVFKEALSLDPADRQIYLAAAGFYYQASRFEEAERILKEAQIKRPDDPEPSFTLAACYRAQNRPADATALLRELKKKFPENATVSLELASAILRGDPPGARAEVDGVLKTAPQNVPAQVLLGELQFRAKQYDQAVATLSAPSVLNSAYPQVRLFLGLIDASKGKNDSAFEHYKKSLDKNPSYAPTRLALAGVLLRLGRAADAKVELQQVLKVYPGSVDARLLQASVDTMEKKFADAEREFNALLKEVPNNATLHLRTGLYYQVRGMAPQAEKNLLRALELEPDSNEILENVAQFYVFQGKTDQALKVINDTVPDEKKSAFHHELVGLVYSRSGRSQDAETAYRKALLAEPDRVTSKANLATEFIQAKRYDEALAQIDDLLKQTPGNASAYMMKGMIFQAKENLAQAKDNYDRALKLDPNSFVAANNLAFLLAEEGVDLEVALTQAQAARRLRPDDANSADTLGWVQYKLGRHVAARDQLQFATSRQPDNPTFQYHLALVYKETKQVAQAQAALRKALSSKANFKQRSLAEGELKGLSQVK